VFECEHCGTKLKEETGKSGKILKCPSCKCVFRVVLVIYDTKCYGKMFKTEIKLLMKERKEKKHGKKGRPKKKINSLEITDKIEHRESLEEGHKGVSEE